MDNLSEGERKRNADLLLTLISERVAAIGDLSERLAEVRHQHATLTLLYKRVTGQSARDSDEDGGRANE